MTSTLGDIVMPGEMPAGFKAGLESTKVMYRQLGKSGLRVSVPILGGMSFGHKKWLEWVKEEEEALPILKAAYDCGLNTWDTANVYSNGESERIIGKALKKYNIPRNKVIIMTKVNGASNDDEPSFLAPIFHKELAVHKDFVNQRGLSRSSILNTVDASLARLDTPYIDVLQIHRFDPTTPMTETLSTLHELVRSGKVRYLGASSMWTYQFCMLQECAAQHGWTQFVSMQNHYSLLYREEEREMNAYCNLTGVGLIPWSPLCRGHLARPRDKTQETTRGVGESEGGTMFKCGSGMPDDAIIDRVQEIAEKRGVSMAQVALAWIMKRVTAPIVGFSSVRRIEEAVGAREVVLTTEEERYLEELYVPKVVQGHA